MGAGNWARSSITRVCTHASRRARISATSGRSTVCRTSIERVSRTLALLGLDGLADRRAAGFSQGERMKVALGRAIVHGPRNLLLDEPTNGLDIPSVRALRGWLKDMRDRGICILFSSHVLDDVRALCDRIVIISRGRVVAHGTADAICRDTGCESLEDAFVRLTRGGGGAAMTDQSLIIARKEIVDHLRDRRSLMSGALYTLMGPLVVMVVSFSGQVGGKPALLLSMMSVFALVSTFTGGMAVAMDITAGERERRSLVPLLLTPIASRHLVLGKWLATCAFALGALAINIAGVAAVMALRAPGPFAANAAPLASWVLLGLAPLACFAAALELLASAACRTTKEANTWLTFVVFVPMMVGMFLVFYPLSGNGWLALPVVGQQLVFGSTKLPECNPRSSRTNWRSGTAAGSS